MEHEDSKDLIMYIKDALLLYKRYGIEAASFTDGTGLEYEIPDIFDSTISKNALFLKLDKYAKYYAEHGEFPEVRLFTPMDGDCARVYQYKKKMFTVLADILKEKYNIDFKFSSGDYSLGPFGAAGAVGVWQKRDSTFFYGLGHRGFSIDDFRKIYFDLCTSKKWPIQNDILSFITESKDLSSLKNYEVESYKDSTLFNLKGQSFYSTILGYPGKDKRIYTPYLFIDNIEKEKLIDLLRIVIGNLEKQNPNLSKKLYSIFDNIAKSEYNLDIYCQFANLVISLTYLNYFIKNAGIKGKFNIDAVAHYYGIEDIASLLNALAEYTVPDEVVSDISSSLDLSTFQNPVSDERKWVRNQLYELGVAQEELVFAFRHGSVTSKTIEKISINDFLNNANNEHLNGLKSILFLLDFLRSHSCSLETTCSGTLFKKFILPTELSLAIMPLELKEEGFIDFFRLANIYLKEEDLDEKVKENFEMFRYNEETVENACYMARVLKKNIDVADDILCWRSLFR